MFSVLLPSRGGDSKFTGDSEEIFSRPPPLWCMKPKMLIAGGYFTILLSEDFIFVGQFQVLSQLEGKVQRFHLGPLPPRSKPPCGQHTRAEWDIWYKLWTCTDMSTPLRVHSWWEGLVLVVSLLWVPHSTHTQTNHRDTHRPHTPTDTPHHTHTGLPFDFGLTLLICH